MCLGRFETAVEAAVAYARYCEAEGRTPRGSVQPAATEVVEEAEGWRLHLSSRNATGYKYVHINNQGTVYARPKNSKSFHQYLGAFASTVEAAVAVARFLRQEGIEDAGGAEQQQDQQQQQQQLAEEEQQEGEAMDEEGEEQEQEEEERQQQDEEEGEEQEEEEEDDDDDDEEEEQEQVEQEQQQVVEEVKGLRLHLSQRNATGYNRGYKVASALHDGSAPSVSLGYLKAQAASTHSRAQPGHLGGSPWPPQLASAVS